MAESLNRIIASAKTGREPLTQNNNRLNYSLLDFWRWSVSDILSNATRGRFAEFIVATATKIDIGKVRDEWGAYDLTTPEGIKIEVKSAAYLQSWNQKAVSKISFSIKLSRHWDAETNILSAELKRHADVYTFCLLKHEDKSTVDPLNLDHWEFYVLATAEVNGYKRSQHSITLASLRKLTHAVSYDQLYGEMRRKSTSP